MSLSHYSLTIALSHGGSFYGLTRALFFLEGELIWHGTWPWLQRLLSTSSWTGRVQVSCCSLRKTSTFRTSAQVHQKTGKYSNDVFAGGGHLQINIESHQKRTNCPVYRVMPLPERHWRLGKAQLYHPWLKKEQKFILWARVFLCSRFKMQKVEA